MTRHIMESQSIMEYFMYREKHLYALAEKGSQGLQASAALSEIILERYLADILPETRLIPLKELNRITNYDYIKLRKYLGNNYYRVKGKEISIIADNQLLAEKSELHCKRLISELVIPAHFDKEKYTLGTYYTEKEIEFIDFMLNELLSIASINKFSCKAPVNDLFYFNLINHNYFNYSAKRIFNDILLNKLHAGDNIIPYLAENLTGFEIIERLENSCKFDYLFDTDGILKCDLTTNKDILIKNFINTVIYGLRDPDSQAILLQKLDSKYPILINT